MISLFNRKPFLIADIAFNYYEISKKEGCSNIDAVKLMIDSAKNSGADAFNFHIGDLEQIYCSYDEDIDINDFKENALTLDDYKVLFEYCNDLKIPFVATVYNEESVLKLDDYIDIYQISSLDLTNIPFIRFLAKKNKPLLLSTGAATLLEIKNAVKCIEDTSNSRIVLFHCVLSYPTEIKDTNLLMIKDLMEHFDDYEVGYCDNTVSDNNLVLTAAYINGATILEKQFTLDKTLNGHYFAMDANDVRMFKEQMGMLSRINGYKNKQPLICESYYRKNFRKSIVAKKDIKKGETLTLDNIHISQPGDGISPSEIDEIIGKVAVQDIAKDALINFEMFS